MSSNQTTLIGQLAADPELRFLANGDAVASVTVAHSRRKFDKDKDEWVDSGEPLFLRGISVHEEYAADGGGRVRDADQARRLLERFL